LAFDPSGPAKYIIIIIIAEAAMKHSSTTLVSVLALSIVTACGGGGPGGITDLQPVAAASPPPTAERVVTIRGREGPSTSPAVNRASSDSVPHIDPLVAQRVQAELDRIEGALRQLDDSKIEKHEALEVVSDARAELRRDRPNKLRLRSLLTGLAHGVQLLDVKGAGGFLPRLVPLV
jgi:hypothetical protein